MTPPRTKRGANNPLPPVPRTRKVKHRGIVLTLYTVGWLAFLTRRSGITVRFWERKGLIPPPIFMTKRADGMTSRRYTAQELLAYTQAVHESNMGRNRAEIAVQATARFRELTHRAHKSIRESLINGPVDKILKALPMESKVSSALRRTRAELLEGLGATELSEALKKT